LFDRYLKENQLRYDHPAKVGGRKKPDYGIQAAGQLVVCELSDLTDRGKDDLPFKSA